MTQAHKAKVSPKTADAKSAAQTLASGVKTYEEYVELARLRDLAGDGQPSLEWERGRRLGLIFREDDGPLGLTIHTGQ